MQSIVENDFLIMAISTTEITKLTKPARNELNSDFSEAFASTETSECSPSSCVHLYAPLSPEEEARAHALVASLLQVKELLEEQLRPFEIRAEKQVKPMIHLRTLSRSLNCHGQVKPSFSTAAANVLSSH